MFDTMKVAGRIRSARIAQNMTQMNLADAMGVSYQAVSNWERGNSMPDISKLQELCEILHISLEELLGAQAKTVQKVYNRETSNSGESISMEDIREVIPLLPPKEANSLIRETIPEKEKLNLSAITTLAPFLDEDYLDSLVERAQVNNLSEVVGIAPFLSEDTLDRLAMKAENFGGIVSLAPFLSKDTLDKIVKKMMESGDSSAITPLAPFLGEDTLDQVTSKSLESGNISGLSGLYPFLSSKTLQKITEILIKRGD